MGESQQVSTVTSQDRFRVPLRFVYGDPPYFGCCARYDHYHPDGRCWDDLDTHRELIQDLMSGYDGAALAATSGSLRDILPLCPPEARVAAWVKPFASFKPGVNPAYTWEPVIFWGGRKLGRFEPTLKDHRISQDAHAENITLKKGLVGAKPPGYCRFVFQLLGAQPWDVLHDLYPGSGAVTRAWEAFQTEVPA